MKRQDSPMESAHAAPRCQAKSKRSGQTCRCAAMRGKRVCRMHGGKSRPLHGPAHGRYKHGLFTCEAIADRRMLREVLGEARETLASF